MSLAAHVRTNHVHLVVAGEARPERVMNDLKSYASRDDVSGAIQYVVEGQGEAMAVYLAEECGMPSRPF